METLFADPRVVELLGGGLAREIDGLFRQMAIAEEMIADARGGKTEPDKDDPLWGAFRLVRPTHARMSTEFVYRAHLRELLRRVQAGEDTRPGTDAEIVCGISEASYAFPLNRALTGLQARLFQRSMPEQFEVIADAIDLETYERTESREMDEWEARLRRKASQEWRR
jgi:hypothetical protein